VAAHATDRFEPVAAVRSVQVHRKLVVADVADVAVAAEHGVAVDVMQVAPVLAVHG
jgi:hypothetical protein